MPAIGIILCETLELEFADLLANDNDVDAIYLINSGRTERIFKALLSYGIQHISIVPHLSALRLEPSELLRVLAWVLPMKLHKNRDVLRETILNAARQLSRYVDRVFLGYGICGTGNANPEIFEEIGKPVFTLSKQENPIDDCVGLILGGRKRYYSEQCSVPGTYYMTPGWTYHWRWMLENGEGMQSQEALKRMFKNYKRILLLKTPVMDENEMIRNAEDLVKLLHIPVEIQEGTMKLLEYAWNSVKTGKITNS